MEASLGEDETEPGQGKDQVREVGPKTAGHWLRGPTPKESWGAWPCVTPLPTSKSPFLQTCEVSGAAACQQVES